MRTYADVCGRMLLCGCGCTHLWATATLENNPLAPHSQFTCFPSTKVQILTQMCRTCGRLRHLRTIDEPLTLKLHDHLITQTARQRLSCECQPRARLRHTLSHRPVSVCTFVPVKQVKCVRAPATCSPQAHSEPQTCQHLYFCTSKTSKVGASKESKVRDTPQEPAGSHRHQCREV